MYQSIKSGRQWCSDNNNHLFVDSPRLIKNKVRREMRNQQTMQMMLCGGDDDGDGEACARAVKKKEKRYRQRT